MMNITSHVFISQNGMQQVELNYDDKNRADVLHRQFNSDGVEIGSQEYPRRKPISEIMDYIHKLEEDHRYIDMSSFSEEEQEVWREKVMKVNTTCDNRSAGSPWRAMGAGIKPNSFEEYWGCTPEEHYYPLKG